MRSARTLWTFSLVASVPDFLLRQAAPDLPKPHATEVCLL